MAKSPYDIDLDRNPANYPAADAARLSRARGRGLSQPYRHHPWAMRRSYAEFYARARQLASALAKRGIKRGDTVSVMLANTPAMLEATTACR